MAGKTLRKTEEQAHAKSDQAPRYTKAQLAGAEHFKTRRDLLEALLENGCIYTVSEADKAINRFMKGKVSLC